MTVTLEHHAESLTAGTIRTVFPDYSPDGPLADVASTTAARGNGDGQPPVTTLRGSRCTDADAHDSAIHFLEVITGTEQTDLTWDLTFRLQGHAHVGSYELVVIAPRDLHHRPVILTVEDWDRVRHSERNSAARLVAELAISTPQQLDDLVHRHHT